ncbi:MAG: beta-propeller domain-containing protein [Deltaproteobacteria bacterium]|nr:beta-propeller domain-containing protein [Deltaproteobacteria bacterium]
MTRIARSVAPLALALAACSGGAGTGGPHPPGATRFESAAPTVGATSLDTAPATGSGGPAPRANDGAAPARAVEEADVYRQAGSILYVLNAYRGLTIVDLADPAAPRMLARVPVTGTPVDLYLRGSVALVVVSDWFSYLPADGGSVTRPVRGSRLLAVDVADPAAPVLRADLAIDGQIQTTRIVGDVLYAVARRWWWYDWIGVGTPGSASTGVSGPAGQADIVLVASFDVADAGAPRAIDRLELPAGGWDTHAHVTATRATLSFAAWTLDAQGAWGPVTRFQVVDLSDAGGTLAAGASFDAAGLVRDRWSMDHDDATGLFRAVLATDWASGAALQVWNAPDPGTAEPLARLAVEVPESLTAVRFDGARVYLVTALRVDPLWVADTSDPAHPRLAGHLTMPGQLDFLEPRGDRLVALGHTNEAGQPFQLAVSLFDVSDASAPALLSRAIFGSSFGWLGAAADDLHKAFLVFDPPPAGIGLVLVPLQGWDAATGRYAGGTQLIDLSSDALTLRGFLSHPGAVSRAFPLDAQGQTLVALSDQALQTIGAADRGRPTEQARLDLARSVAALAIVGDQAVELCGDWYRGDMELAVTPALDPDAAVPLARFAVASPHARLYQDGTIAWLLAREPSTGQGWLQAVDLSDPVHPAARGRLSLDAEQSPVAVPGCWGYGDEAVRVGRALAVHRTVWLPRAQPYCPGCTERRDRVWVYDLSDPDRPALSAALELPGNGWSWGAVASGPYLWLTHFEWNEGSSRGRFYVDRIDLSSPASPVLLPKVNVPGVLFGASSDGTRIFTLETDWTDGTARTWAHALAVEDGEARLLRSARLAGSPSGAVLAGSHAYVATSTWTGTGSTTRLLALDADGLAVTSDQEVQGSWAWVFRAEGGKLFLQAGWAEQGFLIYGLGDPAHPALDRFVRTRGWVSDVVVSGGRAWLPAGPYGVTVVPLDP